MAPPTDVRVTSIDTPSEVRVTSIEISFGEMFRLVWLWFLASLALSLVLACVVGLFYAVVIAIANAK